MDYELYITRKKNWFDDEQHLGISLEEWADYVKNDPDMRLDNFTETTLPGGELFRYDNPGAAVLVNTRPGQPDEVLAQFDFRSGNISVKNPATDIADKMKHIAFKLGASLQNEEGEAYEVEEEEPVQAISPAEFLPEAVNTTLIKRWWKRWSSVFASAQERQQNV